MAVNQRIDNLTLAARAGFDQMAAGMDTLAQLITGAQSRGGDEQPDR